MGRAKKISLRSEKYDGKVDFEGWVNQFEEYAVLWQWSDEELACILLDCRSERTCRTRTGSRPFGASLDKKPI